MNDFSSLEKNIVRELSCRLCLCSDVVKLKPLSAEIKRKIKRLFDIVVRADDNLPKAICHDCLIQISTMHLYAVKVEKTQKFLDFHKTKTHDENESPPSDRKPHPILSAIMPSEGDSEKKHLTPTMSTPTNLSQAYSNQSKSPKTKSFTSDTGVSKTKPKGKKKNSVEMKLLESMTLEEFAKTEKVDKTLLEGSASTDKESGKRIITKTVVEEYINDSLDPIVLIDGRPARQGPALDRQITLFYKMECCICHESGFHYRSLMRHYKDRHGVPGYVTCCEKKFHYFYPKKIIEHMAFHLQPNIFRCSSCNQNFQTSQELQEHQVNGGRSEGKITCPRCTERYPTYRELGWHIVSHRNEKMQCDYCGKQLKHHHRKKTINHMEDVILCSQCVRTLRAVEKQEKEDKEKIKQKSNDTITLQKYQKFQQAMELSADEDASTD